MIRAFQITVAMLLTFSINSVLFAQGALSGGHTTADCIADEDCTRSVLGRISSGWSRRMKTWPTF